MHVILLILLMTKHYLVDFWLQTDDEWQNKGTFGNIGGVMHSAKHAIFTAIILMFFVHIDLAMVLAVIEMSLHYLIDFGKTNINQAKGYTIDTPGYWRLFGFDQLLHNMTYCAIVAVVIMFGG